MLKTAYMKGVIQALLDAGLTKSASGDDPTMTETAAENPDNTAEALEQALEQVDTPVQKQSPTNKDVDKKNRDHADDNDVSWGGDMNPDTADHTTRWT